MRNDLMTAKSMSLLFEGILIVAVLDGIRANAQLPTNFPAITVSAYSSNLVSPGYIFVGDWGQTPEGHSFVMILNNDGTPVDGDKYKELTSTAGDFKVLPNGLLCYARAIGNLSYTGGWDVEHDIVDDTLTNVVETVQMGNGYLSEFHDFKLLPNGNVLTCGYYLSQVDMSQIVSGGNPAAMVSGGVLQELDSQRRVVWQWRSWDHYDFKDLVNSKNAVISGFHFNDYIMDTDGNIIVTTPTELRKINRQTGDVMWILGGTFNQFTIAGTNFGAADFGGHGTYRLPNGNLLEYDNSHAGITSRAIEYTLDETNKLATVVWSYTPPTPIVGSATGNAQRLPNGNTLICWGIPRNANVPVCTEVTSTGQKAFELSFDDTAIESYRAFRFPFPPESEDIQVSNSELADGNSYDFTNTGVVLDVVGGGGGNNTVTVTREPFSPLQPSFVSLKPPGVLPVRVKISASGLSTLNASLSFDAASFGFDNATSLAVYQRSTPDDGLFVALRTTYNPGTKQLQTTVTQFGEFIFGYPDVASIAFPPILNRPENYRGVQTNMIVAPRMAESNVVYSLNQERPILLSWSPKGFGLGFNLQIATEPTFASPVVDTTNRADAYYVWSNALPATTYYWRVQTLVDSNNILVAGDWSTNSFQTVAPLIQVKAPNGGESWQSGLQYFVQWNANISEQVVIDLYKAGAFVRSIATNANTGAYQWEVDLGLAAGNDYSIRIRSATNDALSDFSDAPFSINAVAFDPNSITKLPDGRVQFGVTGPNATEATVLGSTNLISWEDVQTITLTNGRGVFIANDATNLLNRFYRLRQP